MEIYILRITVEPMDRDFQNLNKSPGNLLKRLPKCSMSEVGPEILHFNV